MRFAVHDNPAVFSHSSQWIDAWVGYCASIGVECEVVDLFDPGILAGISRFDAVFWHFLNYSLQEMEFARSILRSIELRGVRTFPDDATSWHYDDKVAQMFLLAAAGAKRPEAWLFPTRASALDWFASEAEFPLVAKLRSGAGASNVRLLRNEEDAAAYANRMFGNGFDPSPSVALKTASNLRSAGSFSELWRRAKRAPEFFRTRSRGSEFPRERGYVYVQEFIPNDGFDLRVVVVGDKLGFVGRRARPNDFRASGGGDVFFDRDVVSPEIRESAFATADLLSLQCVGFDYVVDSVTGEGRIVEMSYAFPRGNIMRSGGYWTRDGLWHDSPLDVAVELIKQAVSDLS